MRGPISSEGGQSREHAESDMMTSGFWFQRFAGCAMYAVSSIRIGLVVLVLLVGLGACNRDPASPQPSSDLPTPDAHTSRNALDWAGSYSGVLTCADCPGIETTIRLEADGSFERRMVYLGEQSTPAVETGNFRWDAAGRTITLSGQGLEPQRYQVGEHRLIQLDRQGRPIEGELAGRYVLEQHVHDPRITDRHWTLIELRGRKVTGGEDESRRPFLHLHSDDGRIHGNASCNMFNGRYAIKTGQRIRFGRNIAMTMMACPDMQLEREFIEVLQTVDNYSLGDDGTMTLNRARMAPLARFVEGKSSER